MSALLPTVGGQSTALLTDDLREKEGKHGFLLPYNKTDDESDTISSALIVVYIRGLYIPICVRL